MDLYEWRMVEVTLGFFCHKHIKLMQQKLAMPSEKARNSVLVLLEVVEVGRRLVLETLFSSADSASHISHRVFTSQ